MNEAWNQWEGSVVNGIYPLRRFLNASDHSAVFLTESTTEGFLNAAIKLVPAADPALTAVQLWHWKTAATFSHAHLIRLLDSGQCEIQGRAFLFVVMEYAEENLSQILPVRALGPDEARELLVPTLDALAFLHRENWVQGQLKPANFLVVNDQLKLAMDTIRPASVAREPTPRPSLYDPPEAVRGEVSTAVDVWALGVTLVESLTQYPPTWLNGPDEPASLPTNLPPDFVDIVQRCLSVDPANRPDVWELQKLTKPASNRPRSDAPLQPVVKEPVVPPAPPPPVEMVVWAPTPDNYTPPPGEPKRSLAKPAAVAIVVVLVAVWAGNHYLHSGAGAPADSGAPVAVPDRQAATTGQPGAGPGSIGVAPVATAADQKAAAVDQQIAATSADTPQSTGAAAQRTATPRPTVSPPSPARTASNPATPAATDNPASTVIHEEIPNASQSARHTIQGHIKVTVRVTVDSSGRVVRDIFENPGPSKYFSRLASQAARKWTFAATDQQSSREWLLRFEFGRDRTTVHATRSGS